MVCNVFAADSIDELDAWGDKVLSLIGSSWIQALCALALAIEAGACIFAGRNGESGMIKKFLPWMVGTIGLLSASSITEFFFNKA